MSSRIPVDQPFVTTVESIRTPALHLDYYQVPWDSEIFGIAVAQIAQLRIYDPASAAADYQAFADWCARQHIALCACRLPGDQMVESMFLEERGFRFVELNYVPTLAQLQAHEFSDEGIDIREADAADRSVLSDMAAEVLLHGRIHQDPRLGPTMGRQRYRTWMHNAFAHPGQQVLKCLLGDAIVAFFVVERPAPTQCFWSLVGLAPGQQGRGLGKRVWKAMLSRHRAEGIDTVSTSISSHNVAVFNLYVSLSFRFPQPSITLQWCSFAGSSAGEASRSGNA